MPEIIRCPQCEHIMFAHHIMIEETGSKCSYGICDHCGYRLSNKEEGKEQGVNMEWRNVVKVGDLVRTMCFIDTVRIYENHSMIFCGKKEDVPKGLLRKEVYQAFCPDTYTINITIS